MVQKFLSRVGDRVPAIAQIDIITHRAIVSRAWGKGIGHTILVSIADRSGQASPKASSSFIFANHELRLDENEVGMSLLSLQYFRWSIKFDSESFPLLSFSLCFLFHPPALLL